MSHAPNTPPTVPPTARELRRFALLVGGASALLGLAAAWRGRGATAVAFGVAGVALLVAGLVAPGRLGGVYRAWMALAAALSRVTTPVWLAVVYFGVFTPIAFLARLAGRRFLARPRGADSYWVPRPPGQRRSDLRRQF